MSYFEIQKLSERIIRITDLTHTHMFMILGDKHMLLIDTGAGVGNLRQFLIQQGFDPSLITVVLTHGHVDHIGGASAFSKVYLSSSDWELYHEHNNIQEKTNYLTHVLGEEFISLNDIDILETKSPDLLDIEDKQFFHLGGVDVMSIALPGHTQGSMCFLILQEQIIILGDACNKSVFLFFPESTTVSDYQKNLISLSVYQDLFTRCLISQGSGETSIFTIDNCISACKSILDGTDDAIPFDFMDYKVKIAYPVDTQFNRLDGHDGNIVYNPRKVK